MPLLITILIIAALLALWWWLDPPVSRCDTLVTFGQGKAVLQRGQFRPAVLAEVRTLLHEAGIAKGHIGITNRRVAFSRSIPKALHQKLRNVILNG